MKKDSGAEGTFGDALPRGKIFLARLGPRSLFLPYSLLPEMNKNKAL